MNDLDQKLERYETTAVDVANKMYNPNLRAENSKEVLENFPNVRLASEKQKMEKVGRGKAIHSSLFLSTMIGACCFGAGYKTREYISPAKQESTAIKASFKKTIDELIEKDLNERGEFVFLGDFNRFTEMYATRLLGKSPDAQQLQIVRDHMYNVVVPAKGYDIEGTIRQWDKKTILVYKRSEVKQK